MSYIVAAEDTFIQIYRISMIYLVDDLVHRYSKIEDIRGGNTNLTTYMSST